MKQRLLWGFLLFSLAAVPIGACWHLLRSRAAPAAPAPLPVHALVPDFTLTDQEGRPFAAGSLRGRVWIADFIFTSCAGACPVMTGQLSDLQKDLPPEIQLVSITVDPARDIPKVLKSYAARNKADPARWHFLTGPAAVLTPFIQNGFRLSVAEGMSPQEPVIPPPDPADEVGPASGGRPEGPGSGGGIIHSQRFVLIDRAGQIRGYYDSTDPAKRSKLIQDANFLVRSSFDKLRTNGVAETVHGEPVEP